MYLDLTLITDYVKYLLGYTANRINKNVKRNCLSFVCVAMMKRWMWVVYRQLKGVSTVPDPEEFKVQVLVVLAFGKGHSWHPRWRPASVSCGRDGCCAPHGNRAEERNPPSPACFFCILFPRISLQRYIRSFSSECIISVENLTPAPRPQ